MIALRNLLGRLAYCSYWLGRACRHGPMILLIAFLISPIGPHLRWDLSGYGCVYVGSRGFFKPSMAYCPLLAWFDTREGRDGR